MFSTDSVWYGCQNNVEPLTETSHIIYQTPPNSDTFWDLCRKSDLIREVLGEHWDKIKYPDKTRCQGVQV